MTFFLDNLTKTPTIEGRQPPADVKALIKQMNARTRAMQADTVAQENMNSELGTIHEARASRFGGFMRAILSLFDHTKLGG
ncbi:hypothetical protein SAMN05444398_101860 [Roseovarius pacificus]|uniref:Uncharacterized protein n=1 Tax=Roseovarius pacificus TaxID=337701 RepID=A0A1M6YHH0_9RHOB|nr:hypothetical protein [Roseovarius pacificus]GGO50871.1 hypothetical protein GCM10011315_02670 [Roseovarius pacificus]SHL17563.1 hypothetical protein SAMN05444398_101860 [Roseovarius pacificus]